MSAAAESTIGDLIEGARRRLREAPFDAPPREAALILGHVLGLSEAQILARRPSAVDAKSCSRFETLLARRLTGEPIAYIFGVREFYGREFLVDRRVLIPRPETEHLVEAALALELPAAPRIVDVGTGSGAIAITLALEIEGARVLGVDIEIDALRVATANRDQHAVRLDWARANVLGGIDLASIDLLVSNPPYVAPEAQPMLSPEVHAFEPHAALFAANAGRSVLMKLLDSASNLRAGTPTLLEIGYDQGDWLRSTIDQQPRLRLEGLIRDYGGIERTAVIRTT